MESRDAPTAARWLEGAFHLLLAGGLVAAIHALQLREPVAYTRLVTEDNWGENTTFVALAFTAAAFALLAWRAGPEAKGMQRLGWLGVALCAGVLAGEEMSWGQRVLGFETPEALHRINLQHETTLHNIEGIAQYDLHDGLYVAMLAWAAISWLTPRALRLRLAALGLPLAPLHLAPWVLVVPWLIEARPFVKSDEVTELVLGAFLVVWATDRLLRQGPLPVAAGVRTAVACAAGLLLVAAGGTLMSSFYPDQGLRHRLNLMGLRDLPDYRLYDQSDAVMAYIYAHPDRFLKPDTRLEHARLLVGLGRPEEAAEVAQPILDEPLPAGADRAARVAHHQRRGALLALLGDPVAAAAEIERAIVLDEDGMGEAALGPDDRASRLLSLSQSLATLDRLDAALDRAHEASAVVETASIRREIGVWTATLERRIQER